MEFAPDRIPQLAEVSRKVEAISGFRLEPVAGLVAPRVFLESLANGVFLCTQYIRHHSTPLYTPEPDVVHEIVGHAVTLASERLAQLNRLFGEAVRRAQSTAVLDQLARVYWFTIEFGVLLEKGKVKAYGTGLLSSAGELEAMHEARLWPLDLDAAQQTYDPTHFQPVLFCADSFDAMYHTLVSKIANARESTLLNRVYGSVIIGAAMDNTSDYSEKLLNPKPGTAASAAIARNRSHLTVQNLRLSTEDRVRRLDSFIEEVRLLRSAPILVHSDERD